VNPPEVTPEMVREAEGHLPFKIGSLTERWQWLAAFLTNALRNPGVPCPCCGVAPNGELFDHMPPMEWRVLQPRGELLNDVAAVRKVLASDQAPTLHAVATALNPESMRR